MSKRSYRSKGKGKRKRAPAPDPEFAGIPAELPHTEEVAPPQAPLAPPAPRARALRDTPAISAADGGRTNLPRSVRDRAPRIEGQVLPEDRPHLDGSRAPRIEGFEGQAPPEDRELIDVSGDGSEECLPPLSDGSRGDLLAPGVPLRNPLVLPLSSLPHPPYHLRGLTRRGFDL